MYLNKKFKRLGWSATVLGLALASCQLVGCGGDDDGGSGGQAGEPEAGRAGAGKAGSTGKAGSGGGGKAGQGTAGEGEAGEGEGGGEMGGTSGGGVGGMSGGGVGGASGSGGKAGSGGSSGAAGSAGKGGTGGTAGSAGSAGTAGSAGKGGSGGTAGSTGSGGSAGSAGSAGAAGSAGKGGSGGTAGSAGSGGSAGSAGKGGAGGTSGGGGSAGGNICGNNLVEAPEVCDPQYSANNCGKDCKAITSPACLTCDNGGECIDFVDCSIAVGNATGGPAVGTKRSNLCNEVLDCVRDSGCAAGGNNITNCYCGTASSAACQSGQGLGACRTELERGLETTVFNEIIAHLKDGTYGGGVAMARIDCEQQICKTACGLD